MPLHTGKHIVLEMIRKISPEADAWFDFPFHHGRYPGPVDEREHTLYVSLRDKTLSIMIDEDDLIDLPKNGRIKETIEGRIKLNIHHLATRVPGRSG